MKKFLILALILCIILLCSCSSKTDDVPAQVLKNPFAPITKKENNVDSEIKTSGIEAFAQDSAELSVGEILEITLEVYPADIAVEDITITNFQDKVVKIRCAQVRNVIDRGVLTFEVVALKGGNTKICVTTAEGDTSGVMNITVTEPLAEDTVTVTKGGSKYHTDSSCIKGNTVEISREAAEKMGYEPCKKCAGG